MRGANKESTRRNGKALTMKLRPRRREYLRLVLPRGDQKCGAFPCGSSDQTYAANSIRSAHRAAEGPGREGQARRGMMRHGCGIHANTAMHLSGRAAPCARVPGY